MNTINRNRKALGLALVSLFAGLMAAKASVINLTVNSSGVLYNGVGVATKDEYGHNDNNPDSNLAFLNTEIGYYNAFNNPDLASATNPIGADYGSLSGDTYTSIGGYDYVVFHFGAGQAEFGEAPEWVPAYDVPTTYKKKSDGSYKLDRNGNKIVDQLGYHVDGHFTEVEMEKSQGGWWSAFYIGGMAGITFTAPTPGPTYEDLVYNGKAVGGFSSARYYNRHYTPPPPPPSVPDSGASVALLGLGLVSLALFRRKAA